MKKIFLIFVTTFFCSFIKNPKPSYYGEFRATKMVNCIDTTLTSIMFHGMSFLYSVPTEETSPLNSINDGTVKYNGKSLYFLSPMRAYIDSANRNSEQGAYWSLSGSSSLPNFNYTCSINYPIYENTDLIPNSISKSSDLIIPLGGAQGADQIEFTIDDLQVRLFYPWYRKIDATLNSIIINKSHLCDLKGEVATIRLTLIKKEEKSFNGKVFKFETRLNINKLVSVTN